MILELAAFKIQPGQEPAFETAYTQASQVLASASGYVSHQMQRSVDVQGHYMLMVQWRSLDDHVKGFRESPLFVEWRRLIGPYFASAPEVEHYELLG